MIQNFQMVPLKKNSETPESLRRSGEELQAAGAEDARAFSRRFLEVLGGTPEQVPTESGAGTSGMSDSQSDARITAESGQGETETAGTGLFGSGTAETETAGTGLSGSGTAEAETAIPEPAGEGETDLTTSGNGTNPFGPEEPVTGSLPESLQEKIMNGYTGQTGKAAPAPSDSAAAADGAAGSAKNDEFPDASGKESALRPETVAPEPAGIESVSVKTGKPGASGRGVPAGSTDPDVADAEGFRAFSQAKASGGGGLSRDNVPGRVQGAGISGQLAAGEEAASLRASGAGKQVGNVHPHEASEDLTNPKQTNPKQTNPSIPEISGVRRTDGGETASSHYREISGHNTVHAKAALHNESGDIAVGSRLAAGGEETKWAGTAKPSGSSSGSADNTESGTVSGSRLPVSGDAGSNRGAGSDTLFQNRQKAEKPFPANPLPDPDSQAVRHETMDTGTDPELSDIPDPDSGLRLTGLHQPAVRKELALKMVQMIRRDYDTTTNSGGWRNHRLVLEDGSKIRFSVRQLEQTLQLQIGSQNPELNRLIQNHISEIRQHLHDQMKLEVNLRFGENEFGRQPDQGSADGFENTGIRRSETARKAGTLPSESMETITAVRHFGFNRQEWTA